MGEYLGVYSTGDTGCLSAPKDFPKDLSSEQMWPSCFRALPVDWALDPLLRVAWQVVRREKKKELWTLDM